MKAQGEIDLGQRDADARVLEQPVEPSLALDARELQLRVRGEIGVLDAPGELHCRPVGARRRGIEVHAARIGARAQRESADLHRRHAFHMHGHAGVVDGDHRIRREFLQRVGERAHRRAISLERRLRRRELRFLRHRCRRQHGEPQHRSSQGERADLGISGHQRGGRGLHLQAVQGALRPGQETQAEIRPSHFAPYSRRERGLDLRRDARPVEELRQ